MTDLLIRIKCNGAECGDCLYNDWHTCWLFWQPNSQPMELDGDPPLRCKECLATEDLAKDPEQVFP